MSGSLGSDHGNVNVSGRNDASEMNVEAMSKHQHVACFQVRLDVLLVKVCLLLVIDQDHDNVSLLCCFCSGINLEALCHCLVPALRALIQTDNHVASGILQIQCVCVSLAAVANDCDCLSVQKGQITIFLVENLCHFFFPPYCLYDKLF